MGRLRLVSMKIRNNFYEFIVVSTFRNTEVLFQGQFNVNLCKNCMLSSRQFYEQNLTEFLSRDKSKEIFKSEKTPD